MRRVQEWRKNNPGYWRNKNGPSRSNDKNALQDHSIAQPPVEQRNVEDTKKITQDALQDHWIGQPLVIVGLIALLTGNTLQDHIVKSLETLQERGRQIMGKNNPNINNKTETQDDETTNTS